jgi:hypothetical protein
VALDQPLLVVPSLELAEGLDQFRDRRERPDLAAYERARRGGSSAAAESPRRDKTPAMPRSAPRPEGPSQPTIRLTPTASQDIDEVPRDIIPRRLLESLQQYGATEEDDLIQAITRQLGFQRTGSRIKVKLAGCVEELAREGKVIRTDGGSLRIPTACGTKRG